jgi:hypothetical protein
MNVVPNTLAVSEVAWRASTFRSQNSCSSWKNMVKAIIVPYIVRPPTIDMSIAGV